MSEIMPPAEMFEGDLIITFKRRKMLHFLQSDSIASDIGLSDMSGASLTIGDNFATLWSRTHSVKGNKRIEDMNEDAYDFLCFFKQYGGKTNYKAIYQEYISACDLAVNNEWLRAFQAVESGEVGRVKDPELQPPDSVPQEVLQDENVQKKELTEETVSEPS